ncbi:PepSY-associated TM helix domain-containing protein [Pseudogemmobacter humi]|uniref:PepSY-associated TM helix n=1 Tax=Pseudogemmobacter humi TaxID=2483812 RepID=A0A3P5X642_9RHOB|nr:PepSY-associated TM helix domain-containing protein [Pseudogemmobacter humi]VDC29998.1 hypothetical protein XINFAN_02367 [Pseudogemmobacter humi]
MQARTISADPRRSFWLRQFRLWHWVSAAISLAGMLMFAVTGFTLNNAGLFAARPETTEITLALPAPLAAEIAAFADETEDPVPEAVADWAAREFRVSLAGRPTETSPDEVYIPLPRPGGDAWLAIDRASGEATYRLTDGGWLAWLNDLHKGRHTGAAWSWFIDLLALACVIFTLTGLGLLWMHARLRPATWPLGWASLALPVIIALLFIH